nr:MAG: polymerase [Freshwater turtle neural virus 1]
MFSKAFFKEVVATPESIVNNRKFDRALRPTNPEILKEKLLADETHLLSLRCLLQHVSLQEIVQSRTDHTLWPNILMDTMVDSARGIEYCLRKYDKTNQVLKLMDQNMRIQHEYISSSLLTTNVLNNREKYDNWARGVAQSTPFLRNLLSLEQVFGLLVEKQGSFGNKLRRKVFRESPADLKKHSIFKQQNLEITCYWNKDTVLMDYKKQKWLLPSIYLIQIHNKICDIISSYLLIQGGAGVCYEEDALNIYMEMLMELTKLSLINPNYFEIAKTLEGMIIAETLVTEESWENTLLLESINTELMSNTFRYIGSHLQEIIQSATTPLRHELGGMSKLCGHPLIDVSDTAEKARERATKSVDLNYYAIQMTRNLSVEQFIRNYIVKRGEWPPVEIDVHAPQALHEAYRRKKDPNSPTIRRFFGDVHPEDYVYVTLQKICELDKLDHYSQYLKDKALTVCRSQAINHYINKTFSTVEWKQTRLLLVHLLNGEDELDMRGYLQRYMSGNWSPEDVLDYLVIKLVPKEKELKTAARPFGCKTYQDRYRGCVQEENVKHFLDAYSEDQAMTLDNLSLVKRMYTFRNLKKVYRGWRVLYINFDVSGWCANFRHETVEPIGKDVLDALYGTGNFFGNTQRSYECSYFYLPDAKGTYHWEGQDGGIEGLNQYTWMTVYIPQMRYALNEFGLHYFVMAYGDDYKAALLIPPDQDTIDLKELKSRVVRVVSDTARLEFGQQMKYFDSYGSEAYISFCKHASVRGVEMPQGVRKIQKCYGATNAFLPTLDDYISSAFSNAHAAARAMPCTYPAYRVALFWGYFHLVTHEFWCDASETELHGAMMVPSSAGGLPVLYLINFHTRAENDHLPTFIDLIHFIKEIDNTLYLTLTNAFEFEVLQDRYETLLRDPYSLPVVKPPLPSGLLRREVIPALKPIIRNEEISRLLDAASDDWTDQIVKALTSGDELHSRVFSSIFACTPKAMVEEIVKRFETAGSIRDILIMRRGPRQTVRILRKVVDAEIKLQRWRFKRLHMVTQPGEWWRSDIRCPAIAADTLRKLWGKPVVGVTMPPLAHLLTVVNSQIGAVEEYARQNHFTYFLTDHENVLNYSIGDHWHMGEEKPFLGHRTRLGSEIPQVRILDTNPFLSKIRTLLDIVSWVNKGEIMPDGSVIESNLVDLVRVLLTLYYRGDPTDLLPFGAQRKSGTIQHHWRSPHYSEHIMPNTLYNTYTWVRGEANTHLHFRGTIDHHTLNFMQVYCHVVHLLQLELEFSDHVTEYGQFWAITNDCQKCMAPIRERPIVINRHLIPAARFSTLEGLEITSFSRSVLLAAAQELRERRPRELNQERVPLNTAATGVVQTLGEQSLIRATRLCDRLDAPMRTEDDLTMMAEWVPGGWQRLVREREIRHIPSRLLAECVLQTVYHMCFKLGRRANLRRYMIRIWQDNPRDLPWMPMLEAIRAAGVLSDVLVMITRISGISPPMCYDNPLAASKFVGEAAISLGMQGILPMRYTWLSYYEEDEVSDHLERFATHAKSTCIWTRLKPLLLRSMRSKIKDDLTNQRIVTAMYLVAATQVADHGTINILLQNARGDAVVIDVIQVDLVDDILYDEALENPDHIIHDLVDLMTEIHAPPDQHPPTFDYLVEENENARDIVELECGNIIKVTIAQATLVDCINRVRDEPEANPIQYRHGETPMDREGEIVVNNEREPQVDIGFHMRGENLPRVDVTNAPIESTIFDTDEVLMSNHALYRLFGQATQSLNKIIELFSILGVDTRSLSRKNIMCLGEGYGGILDFLARISRESHFVYNTIPGDIRFYTSPSVAIESLIAGGHSWDEELVNTSVYDLSEASTVKALAENDGRVYHLITCDAEADWHNMAKYRNMLINVVHLYLKKRSVRGILILKVMVDCTNAVCQALSLLGEFTSMFGLYRLKSSPPGGECYIYGRGIRKVYVSADPPSSVVLSPRLTRRVMTTVARIEKYWEPLLPPLDYSLTLTPPSRLDYYRRFRDVLPAGFIHRLMSRHQLPLTLKDNDYQTPRALTRAICRELRIVRESLWNQYRNGDDHAAGGVHLAMKIILVESSALHIHAISIQHVQVLVHEGFRIAFLDTCDMLLPRLRLRDHPDIFKRQMTVHGVRCSPLSMWSEGLEIALSQWAYNHL